MLTATCTNGGAFAIAVSAASGPIEATGAGSGRWIAVYGRIPAEQSSAIIGTHSDTIIATIDF